MMTQNDQMADGGSSMADLRQSTPEEQLEQLKRHLKVASENPPKETRPVTFRQIAVAQTPSGLMLYGISFGGHLYRASNPAGQLALKDLHWDKLPEAKEPNADYDTQLKDWNEHRSNIQTMIAAKEAELDAVASVNDTAATLANTVSDAEDAAKATLEGSELGADITLKQLDGSHELEGDAAQDAESAVDATETKSGKRTKAKKRTNKTTEDAAPPASNGDVPVDEPDGEPKPAP